MEPWACRPTIGTCISTQLSDAPCISPTPLCLQVHGYMETLMGVLN